MADLFPPFVPDTEEPRPRRFKPVPFRVIAPNLITLIALCIGLTAIRMAYEGRLEIAVILIVVSAVLDGVDGRVARLLKGTSRFGAELDSLSDFVCFGVAPALILHGFVLHEVRGLGWIAALVLAMAAGLRLARFNVMLDDPSLPEWHKDFFMGVPAPAGALLSLLPVYLHFLGVPVAESGAAPLALVYVLVVAFLMVSSIRTFSGKTMGKRIPREWVLPIFLLTVALVGLLVSFPFEALAIAALGYLAFIPFSMRRFRQLTQADRAAAAAAGPQAAPIDPSI